MRHLDADGDEIHVDGVETAVATRLEETLRLADIRQRQYLLQVPLDLC